jgi:hypothetical protein
MDSDGGNTEAKAIPFIINKLKMSDRKILIVSLPLEMPLAAIFDGTRLTLQSHVLYRHMT